MVNGSNCKLFHIIYRKSAVGKYVYNMYQVNALSGNISSALALLAEKQLGLSVPTKVFCMHQTNLGVISHNKLSFNQHIDEMSQKATNLSNLFWRSLCSKEVENSAYNVIVYPHLEYASTCWNSYIICNMGKLEAVQHRAVRFVLHFKDYVQLLISVVISRDLQNGTDCNTVDL